MLVVRCHHSWPHVGAPWHGLAVGIIEGHCRQNTRRTNLKLNVCSLIEDECKDILVVGHSTDHLHHKLSVANNSCSAAAVVGMLVLQAVILLVQANHILELDGLALGVGAETIEIFDTTEAVTAKRQLVCRDTESNITDVKGLLTVVWSARI